MDTLPNHLIIDILSRLNDSTDVARCRCVSKTLNTLARQVRSIDLYCSLERHTKMRSPELKATPVKTVFEKLVSGAQVPIESVSLGVEEALVSAVYNYGRKYDFNCLFFTAGPFTDAWTSKIGHNLKSLSIANHLIPQFGWETNILEILSHNCHMLVELKLKNASLCGVDDMQLMPFLTKLTLEYVRMQDDSLIKLMECVPGLELFDYISKHNNYGGTYAEIHHLNLKEFKWNNGGWCVAIFAPNLTKLEIVCDFLDSLSIHAPLVSYFHLAVERVEELDVGNFKILETLRLVSPDLHRLFSTFPSCTNVQNLILDSPTWLFDLDTSNFSLLNVYNVFPNVTSLTLGSQVCSEEELYPLAPLAQMVDLKQITVYLMLDDIEKALSFILCVVGICTHLSDIVLFIHRDVDVNVAIGFVSRCSNQCPRLRLRWGTWKEGTKDSPIKLHRRC